MRVESRPRPRRAPAPPTPHDAIRELQRSAGNRAVGAMLQRALWTWTNGSWRLTHSHPSQKLDPPPFPGTTEGERYDTELGRAPDDWVVVDRNPQHQNCTDFAFDGDPDLALVADLGQLLQTAAGKGYALTNSPGDAAVVLYGASGHYSHAIKRIGSTWFEVQSLGGAMRRYTRGPTPPATHEGDTVVAMLRKGALPLTGGGGQMLSQASLQREVRPSYHVKGFEHFNAQIAYSRFLTVLNMLSPAAQEALQFFYTNESGHTLEFRFLELIEEDKELRGLTLPMASGTQLDANMQLAGSAVYVFVVKLAVKLMSNEETVDLDKIVRTMQHEVEFHVVPRYRRMQKGDHPYANRDDHANPDNVIRSWGTYLRMTQARRERNPAVGAMYFEDALQDLENNLSLMTNEDIKHEAAQLEPLLRHTEALARAVFDGRGGSRTMLTHVIKISTRLKDAAGIAPQLDWKALFEKIAVPAWF
jgi:hypothetical protein